MTKDLIKRFIGNIRKKGYIKDGDKILIGCSGGVDSTVLLDLLFRIKDKYNLNLKILHVNHSLRGSESDRDEEFAGKLAEKYNLRFISEKVDVYKFTGDKKYSLEERARIARYDVFERALKQEKYTKTALGHNADDLAETIILNFFKGYSLESLKGFSEIRDKYIRPLIIFNRGEIEEYAELKNIAYVEDSSNFDTRYKRNSIRHHLLPQIKNDINPGIIEIMGRWNEIFTQTGDFLEYSCEEALKDIIKKKSKSKFILDINIFKGYFTILQKYIINRVLRELSLYEKGVNHRIPDKIIELVNLKKTGKTVVLSPDYRAYIDRDELIICREEEVYDNEFLIVVNNEYDFLDGKLRFESKTRDYRESGFSGRDGYWDEIVDYDSIDKNSMMLRFWKEGDVFRPLGMSKNKKVKIGRAHV